MAYHAEDGSCRPDMDQMTSACATYITQCIAFLGLVEQSGDISFVELLERTEGPLFLKQGWLLMSASPGVLDLGSAEELLFVSALRDDIALTL